MEHDKVQLEERHFVGIFVRIEDVQSASFFVGALWDRFHREQIFDKVEERLGDDFFGVYYDYAGDHTQPYSLLAGCEVQKESATPNGMTRVVASKSEYARYEAIGMFPEALIETWQEVWRDGELKRGFGVDFEHYGPKFHTEPPQVDLYIQLKG